MALQQLLTESGAAAAEEYLHARGLTSVALLARSAKDEGVFVERVVKPFIEGTTRLLKQVDAGPNQSFWFVIP